MSKRPVKPTETPAAESSADMTEVEATETVEALTTEPLTTGSQSNIDASDLAVAPPVLLADSLGAVDMSGVTQSVAFRLPRTVLIALLDPTSDLGDRALAEALGLLWVGELTVLGKLIIDGTDRAALRHKLATAWRTAHNAEIDKG